MHRTGPCSRGVPFQRPAGSQWMFGSGSGSRRRVSIPASATQDCAAWAGPPRRQEGFRLRRGGAHRHLRRYPRLHGEAPRPTSGGGDDRLPRQWAGIVVLLRRYPRLLIVLFALVLWKGGHWCRGSRGKSIQPVGIDRIPGGSGTEKPGLLPVGAARSVPGPRSHHGRAGWAFPLSSPSPAAADTGSNRAGRRRRSRGRWRDARDRRGT